MFKCSECNKEYTIKPDYCDDCGNDEFIEVSENNIEETKKNKIAVPMEERQPAQEPVITEKELIDIKKNKTTERKEINPKEILSYFIFSGCLILSFIILFLINPETKQEVISENKSENTNTEIPALDSFWNNKPAKPAPAEIKKPDTIIKAPQTAQTVIKSAENKENEEKKKISLPLKKTKDIIGNNVKPVQKAVQTPRKVSQNTVQKPVQKQPQPQIQTQKPAQTTTNKSSNINVQTNQPAQSAKQPIWQDNNKVQSSSPANTTTNNTSNSAKNQTVVDSAALKKELQTYKSSLRNTIGRKIDFADVVGDGICSVSFKIDSSGRLINRAFQKQSTNTTLNDAVFKAVKNTPSYNPPPKGYNGETLVLKISFYNGNFEISLN